MQAQMQYGKELSFSTMFTEMVQVGVISELLLAVLNTNVTSPFIP